MEAIVLEENPAAQGRVAAALAEAGFEVTLADDVRSAKSALRRGIHDVLILSERIGGRLAHDVALLAELRNPGLGTLLVTDRADPDVAELFDLIPSVRAVLGRRTPARTLARLALAAARRDEAAEGDDFPDSVPGNDGDAAAPRILFRSSRPEIEPLAVPADAPRRDAPRPPPQVRRGLSGVRLHLS